MICGERPNQSRVSAVDSVQLSDGKWILVVRSRLRDVTNGLAQPSNSSVWPTARHPLTKFGPFYKAVRNDFTISQHDPRTSDTACRPVQSHTPCTTIRRCAPHRFGIRRADGCPLRSVGGARI